MKQNIIDQINALHHTPCIQSNSNHDMITLSQLKTRNFLASTSSRYFKVPEVDQPKPKKKQINIAAIQYKFELEDDICHKVLQQVLQSQKNRNPLLPLHRHHQPNHSMKGLSIGKVDSKTNNSIQQVNSSIDELKSLSKTSRMNKILKRNSSQPLLDESRQISYSKNAMANNSKDNGEKLTERSKHSRIHLGCTFQASQTQTKLFEMDFDSKVNRDSSVKRRLSQKQFNIYKNRKLAVNNIAAKFKQIKEEEIQERRKSQRESQQDKVDRSIINFC